MTIKIKVKYLVYFLLVLFAALPLFAFFIQPKIELTLAQHELENNEETKARERIEGLLQSTSGNQRWEIIKDFMIEPTAIGHYHVYIGSSMTSMSHDRTSPLFTIEEIVPYLHEYILHAPLSGYIQSAAEILASHYTQNNQYEKADQALAAAQNRYGSSTYEFQNLLLKRVEFAERAGEPAKLQQIITFLKEQKLDDHLEVFSQITEVEVKEMLRNQQYEEAYNRLTKDIEKLEKEWDEQTFESDEEIENDTMFLHSSPFISELMSLRNHLEKTLNNGKINLTTIKGKVVKSNGEPLANVGVFLRDERTANMSPNPDDPFYTVTNQDGHYEFNGILPGSYQIQLGLTLHQVDGWTWPVEMDEWIDVKGETEIIENIEFRPLITTHSPVDFKVITTDSLTFEWSPVTDAEYYELSLQVEYDSGSMGVPFRGRIKQTSLGVPVEDLYAKSVGIVHGGDPIMETIQPESLLAFSNTNGRFSWYVTAYDKNGNLLTRSNGYRLNEETMEGIPVFYLKERAMTKADSLVMERDIEEALQQYKQNYESNPNDLHSLQMITRLIGLEQQDYEKGLNKALPYMLQLAELQPTEDTLFSVVSHYYDEQNWKEFNSWFKQYQMIVNGEPSTYVKSIYATALMKQGQLEEARNLFQQVMQEDASHRFVGNWIAVEVVLNGSYKEALHIAENYSERSYTHRDWKHIISNLEDEPIEEVKKSIQSFFEGSLELESIQNEDIATFIKALSEVK
ncbi:thioredoxin-like negative regulator of GroEL [Bacillus mesophilus]|uniref:Carboxypeptidase regulatory-like domain-containing protein n=1 Tax=Bacillus mesophilus TaxID=1808955 RepID=A0A6M0QCN5_9BACI|nr:carboxypeptidase-like regulatory domain-containing protein [Bacillus mesophilus]MBM7662900.1 thioredoxin-like negative regulator of GroEL [Bacillus mesophilus]NEY73489.1 carboxypeptidase regulatory-like domain-containing protein [Bacillus mesophilus]